MRTSVRNSFCRFLYPFCSMSFLCSKRRSMYSMRSTCQYLAIHPTTYRGWGNSCNFMLKLFIASIIVPSRWCDGQPYISLLPLLHKKVAVFVFLLYCLSTPTYTIKNKSRCLCLVYHVFGFPTIHFCFHDLLQGKLSLVDRLFSLFRRFLWIS